MTYPNLPYAFTEIYCAVFAVIVWVYLNDSIGSQHEIKELRNMIYSYLGMLITDIMWALNEDGIISLPYYLNAFINAVTIISITLGCYFWFRFIEDRLHFTLLSGPVVGTLMKIPMIVLCFSDLMSIFTKWVFYIDAGGHFQNTSYFIVNSCVNYFYLLIPTVYSAYRASKTRSVQERHEYCAYAFYMIAPLISGIFEDTFKYIPLIALNIFMMILILFLMIQNMQIYNDALTGLNNRRRLNQYLDESISKATDEHRIMLFIMDINDFKTINDAYGHLEGDKALKDFSDILRNTATTYNAFAARYGGDEFCMVMEMQKRQPEEIKSELQKKLHEAAAGLSENNKYTITVSIGYIVCNGTDNKTESVLAAADRLHYENKVKWHLERK